MYPTPNGHTHVLSKGCGVCFVFENCTKEAWSRRVSNSANVVPKHSLHPKEHSPSSTIACSPPSPCPRSDPAASRARGTAGTEAWAKVGMELQATDRGLRVSLGRKPIFRRPRPMRRGRPARHESKWPGALPANRARFGQPSASGLPAERHTRGPHSPSSCWPDSSQLPPAWWGATIDQGVPAAQRLSADFGELCERTCEHVVVKPTKCGIIDEDAPIQGRPRTHGLPIHDLGSMDDRTRRRLWKAANLQAGSKDWTRNGLDRGPLAVQAWSACARRSEFKRRTRSQADRLDDRSLGRSDDMRACMCVLTLPF